MPTYTPETPGKDIVFDKPRAPVDESSGGSEWKLLKTAEYTVNTEQTSAAIVGKLSKIVGLNDKDKIIYVRIRDKAGKRPGYFFGSDCFFINWKVANGDTAADLIYAGRIIHSYTSEGKWYQFVGATSDGYGVYAYSISGKVLKIYRRYNSNYSLKIDGTYTVEVYSLNYPDGISPYNEN